MSNLRKTRKIKTKRVMFRLSMRQHLIVDRYCRAHELTTNKLVKAALKEFLVNNYDLEDDNYVSRNQLSLFDFEDEAIEQQEVLVPIGVMDTSQMMLF